MNVPSVQQNFQNNSGKLINTVVNCKNELDKSATTRKKAFKSLIQRTKNLRVFNKKKVIFDDNNDFKHEISPIYVPKIN